VERTTGAEVTLIGPSGVTGSIRAAIGDDISADLAITFPTDVDAGPRDGG
jgi:hypothetical protein